MEPEETTPSGKKKFLKILLGVLAVIAVLLGTAFFLTAQKNARQAAEQALGNVTEVTKEPTEAEKLAKAQNEELDRLRAQYQTQSATSSTTTLQTQVKSLDAIRNQTLKQTTTAPKNTIEQQNQELDALRSVILNK